MRIEALRADHWPDVRRIYEEGIATKLATFETSAPTWEEWNSLHMSAGRIVAIDDGIHGWAALSSYSSRCVYAGVAEVSVYVGADSRGRGVGRMLLQGLISSSESAGIWTLRAGIFPQNGASLHLHQRAGFRVVGVQERLGQLRGEWRDVVLLERRSETVGR